jgi:hypothetical protein
MNHLQKQKVRIFPKSNQFRNGVVAHFSPDFGAVFRHRMATQPKDVGLFLHAETEKRKDDNMAFRSTQIGIGGSEFFHRVRIVGRKLGQDALQGIGRTRFFFFVKLLCI